jgi:hypothetical protein
MRYRTRAVRVHGGFADERQEVVPARRVSQARGAHAERPALVREAQPERRVSEDRQREQKA